MQVNRDKTPVSHLEINEGSGAVCKPCPTCDVGMQQGIGCSRIDIHPNRVPGLVQPEPHRDHWCKPSLHRFVAKDMQWHPRRLLLENRLQILWPWDAEDERYRCQSPLAHPLVDFCL